MILQTTRRFDKAFAKLSDTDQGRVEATLRLFVDQPFHASLRNHALSGKLRGLRAISAGYDLRVVYEEEKGHVRVLLLNVGKHDDVY